MNESLQNHARKELKDGLSKLPENHQNMFKRMYSSVNTSINDVVDSMDEDKLDWAMQQVQRSIDKIKKLTTKE